MKAISVRNRLYKICRAYNLNIQLRNTSPKKPTIITITTTTIDTNLNDDVNTGEIDNINEEDVKTIINMEIPQAQDHSSPLSPAIKIEDMSDDEPFNIKIEDMSDDNTAITIRSDDASREEKRLPRRANQIAHLTPEGEKVCTSAIVRNISPEIAQQVALHKPPISACFLRYDYGIVALNLTEARLSEEGLKKFKIEIPPQYVNRCPRKGDSHDHLANQFEMESAGEDKQVTVPM
ncbi:hypothetical protein GX51_00492 [Blastomyces parvus]|uniref:Uncharacterized protein n=1 Tax=Blastomyces parvus TaxID=2060905 RepID=A0A2B7XLI1_9EURO|nr:hypothetical protein GX51_00492 [Blastomyces parvus]